MHCAYGFLAERENNRATLILPSHRNDNHLARQPRGADDFFLKESPLISKFRDTSSSVKEEDLVPTHLHWWVQSLYPVYG